MTTAKTVRYAIYACILGGLFFVCILIGLFSFPFGEYFYRSTPLYYTTSVVVIRAMEEPAPSRDNGTWASQSEVCTLADGVTVQFTEAILRGSNRVDVGIKVNNVSERAVHIPMQAIGMGYQDTSDSARPPVHLNAVCNRATAIIVEELSDNTRPKTRPSIDVRSPSQVIELGPNQRVSFVASFREERFSETFGLFLMPLIDGDEKPGTALVVLCKKPSTQFSGRAR
jgi:hypothetical protein